MKLLAYERLSVQPFIVAVVLASFLLHLPLVSAIEKDSSNQEAVVGADKEPVNMRELPTLTRLSIAACRDMPFPNLMGIFLTNFPRDHRRTILFEMSKDRCCAFWSWYIAHEKPEETEDVAGECQAAWADKGFTSEMLRNNFQVVDINDPDTVKSVNWMPVTKLIVNTPWPADNFFSYLYNPFVKAVYVEKMKFDRGVDAFAKALPYMLLTTN